MAMSPAAALLSAQYRAGWNRILRTAGFGGEVATWITLGIVALVLLVPALLMSRIGLDLGYEIASSGDAGVMQSWNGLIAVFTLGFALLGAFRARPSFPSSRFGRYPLRSIDLLVAELPAGLFEVFPLLATGGLVAMNVGLAIRMPGEAPFIVLLTLLSIGTMLATMFIAAALVSSIARRRLLLACLVASGAAATFVGGIRGLRTLLKVWLPAIVDYLPIGGGYEGLVALRSGHTARGVTQLAIALASTIVLLAIAAELQRRRLAAESAQDAPARRLLASIPLSGSGQATAVLFLIRLLSRRSALGLLLIPLLYSAPIALTASMGRAAIADGRELPAPALTFTRLAEEVPLFAVFPLLSIAMNAQIWLNQFGWDRAGMRLFLLLPLEPRAMLTARLKGLLFFTTLQSAVAALPLLAIRMPGFREIVIGIAAGGVALLVTTGVGQLVSIRYPRGIDADSSAQIPLHLSWIAPVTLLATGAELAGLWFLFESIVPGAGPLGLVLSLVGVGVAYAAMLPRLAALLQREQERLLGM
ncbi:MAG: hypothetical protein HYU52_01600 [Acidobacteria bacterium]|nr:hypothetical protein [Acidobacteriota bacterium]